MESVGWRPGGRSQEACVEGLDICAYRPPQAAGGFEVFVYFEVFEGFLRVFRVFRVFEGSEGFGGFEGLGPLSLHRDLAGPEKRTSATTEHPNLICAPGQGTENPVPMSQRRSV